MTIDLGATVAPQALTIREILEVTATAFVVYGVTYRAMTHAGFWNDPGGLYARAEEACEDVALQARSDLDSWLADMKTDGEPRFYNSEILAAALRDIAEEYRRAFTAVDDEALPVLIAKLEDREFDALGVTGE